MRRVNQSQQPMNSEQQAYRDTEKAQDIACTSSTPGKPRNQETKSATPESPAVKIRAFGKLVSSRAIAIFRPKIAEIASEMLLFGPQSPSSQALAEWDSCRPAEGRQKLAPGDLSPRECVAVGAPEGRRAFPRIPGGACDCALGFHTCAQIGARN